MDSSDAISFARARSQPNSFRPANNCENRATTLLSTPEIQRKDQCALFAVEEERVAGGDLSPKVRLVAISNRGHKRLLSCCTAATSPYPPKVNRFLPTATSVRSPPFSVLIYSVELSVLALPGHPSR